MPIEYWRDISNKRKGMKPNNYMRNYFILLLYLFFMLLISPLPAGSKDLIKVGVYQNAPLTFIEENGSIKGFFIDILEHIAKEKDWKIEYVPSSFPECLSNLENGSIDLLGVIAYSKTRGRKFDFTYENVITNWGQIYLNKKSDIESIIDLKGKKVAVLQNDIYFNNLRELVNQSGIRCRFIEAFEYEDVLELVDIGRCDAGLVSQIYGLQRERDYDIIKSSILLSPQKLYWATSKGKSRELLDSLDRYLRELKDNQKSIYYESLSKWFGVGERSKFGKWFKWMISGFAVLLILFFTVSLILRVQVKSKTNELLIKNEELKKEITYREDAEADLLKEKNFSDLVLNSLPGIFYLFDENGHFVEWNKNFETVTGYSQAEIQSMHPTDFFAGEEKDIVARKIHEALTKGKAHVEANFVVKNDRRIPYYFTGHLMVVDGEKYVLGVGIDISSRKNAEKERRYMEAQLRQAHKMESIGTLAGGIAHDFNNILGIILGNIELAIDDAPEWDPAKHNLEEIRTASLRAKDVVRQLLSFARKTTLEKKPTKIAPIVEESLKLLRSSIPTSIEIHQDISTDVDYILADPTQINQILINLCINAGHAMPDGGIIKVVLKGVNLDEDATAQYPDLNPGRYVNLTVGDTGHGISNREMDRIFDPYFTTKEVGKGTGMGLAVIHGVVEEHNGIITVESEVGKGTTFSIFFPAVNKEVIIEPESTKKLPTGDEKILFIDDEVSIGYVGQNRLERLGYQVEIKTSPVEALELFRTNPDQFDLVITDMTMPQMTGDKLVKEILKIRPDIPVILCTGFSEKMDERKTKVIGAVDYIEKPVNWYEFASKVRKVLDRK